MRDRRTCALFSREYRLSLAVPWKLATFAVAGGLVIFIAPYSGDRTWDYFDGTFMSVLTFATAPWSVGTLYRASRGRAPLRHAYAAFCVWMFSASWGYDLYMLYRDGVYPPTWLPNIFLSSVLYCSAGLLWSLDWRHGRGATFSFLEDGWPASVEAGGFRRLWWAALPFIVIGAALVLPFLRKW
ncbi:MAG: hypothetical protein HZC51_13895 [Nitrospirae bacterium]|nr:hypothetical protein [Nitrospirota bacterium]